MTVPEQLQKALDLAGNTHEMHDFDANWQRCKGYLKDTLEGLWTLDAVEQEIREERLP